MAAPMPFEAPVTTATFPDNLLMFLNPSGEARCFVISIPIELMRLAEQRIQLEGGEAFQVGFPDVAAEGGVGEFAVAPDVDEAGCVELFQVMGDSSGSETDKFADGGATGGGFGFADSLKHFEALGVGEGFGDAGELAVVKVRGGRGGHFDLNDSVGG